MTFKITQAHWQWYYLISHTGLSLPLVICSRPLLHFLHREHRYRLEQIFTLVMTVKVHSEP